MKYIICYETDKYLKSGKIMMPFVLLMAYNGFAHSIAPQNILDSFSLSSIIIFLLMFAVGIMYEGIQDQMIAQSIVVKLKNKGSFYFAKVMSVGLFSAAGAVLSVFYPLLVHVISGGSHFERSVTLMDLISGFLLLFLIGLVGGVLGLFFNGRFIKNRPNALLLAALVGMATIVKVAACEVYPWIKWIAWILPPVNDLNVAYSQDEFLNLIHVLPYFLWMAAYLVILIGLYIKLMKMRKFE